ncbi:hypothetical protein FLL45_08120 [Aliikangiella marina]|uniref:Insecticide toxin TcdB middle/N-terminal domain-containing protein n=1 Tax=Aliikangiella marina TaxID=1712262 RepID=A0A545TCK5_9GAMM|nr:RHS repeat-associated core domain-containing protein [Aliikangiella marina]TQV74916.1 hypothetical protein FLL45_08120 [Aliikangiella marina]
MRTFKSYLLGILGSFGLALSNNALAAWEVNFTQPAACAIPQSTSTHQCSVTFAWSQEYDPETGPGSQSSYTLQVNSQVVGSGTSGNFTVALNPGQNTFNLVGHQSGSLYVKYEQYNEYSNSSSTHNTIYGDFNGDGIADRFLQAKSETGNNSLMPVALDDYLNPSYHREWTTTHPNVTAIQDWSEESYGVFVGNFTSSAGDEIILLGNKDIILLHGDIITPISVFPAVNNAIVSWNASGTASYTEFSFDANPADYIVHVGNLDSDSYDEIFLQAAKKGGTSYILDNNGSVIQTISNGYLNAEWSAQSYAVAISNKTLVMTGLSAGNDNNVAYVNSSGAINVLQTPITQVNLQNSTYRKYAFEGVEYRFEPSVSSSSTSVLFSASGLPSWLKLNSSNGLLYGTPTSADVNKSHTVTVTAKENKTHSISDSISIHFSVEEAFSIANKNYNVYQASDGALFLVATSGSEVYKVIDDGGVRQVIMSSTAELNGSGATLQTNYSVSFEDKNLDGLTDLVISGAPGAGLDSWMINNVNGNYHDVVIINQPIRHDLDHGPDTLPSAADNPLAGANDSLVVGSIPAEFGVKPSGSATYNIPIMVAPGSGGLVPQLSLAYDSHGGNGYVGVGWNIQGLSLIHHCQENREQEGVVVPGKFWEFKYCLNGKKLFWDEASQRYSTEDKTSLNIQRNGDEFTEYHTNGSRTVYSKIRNSKFLVQKQVDAAGNYIEFVYDNLPDEDPRLSRVLYTGNENNNSQPLNAIFFEYENRDDPIFKRGSFEVLNKTTRLKRVTSRVNTTTSATGGDELRTYELLYKYANATGRSLVESIEVCRDGSCLPKTTFNWQEGDILFSSVNQFGSGSAFGNDKYGNTWGYQYLDFDGDGITDYWKNKNDTGSSSDDLIIIKGGHPLTQLEVKSNYLNSNFRLSTSIIDYNNDGKDEVMYKDALNWYIIPAKQVSPTRFHDFDNPINTQMPAFSNQVGSVTNHKVYPADHNGDGYPDIVYIKDDKIWIRYNLKIDLDNANGQALFSDPVELPLLGLTDPSGLPGYGLPIPTEEDQDQRNAREEKLAYFLLKFEKFFRPIDFDGDGISEYVIYMPSSVANTQDGYVSSGAWLLYKKRTNANSDTINSYNDFVYVGHLAGLNALDNDDIEFVDLNQDGRLDAVSIGREPTSVTLSHAYRNGYLHSAVNFGSESPWIFQIRNLSFFSGLTQSTYDLSDYFKEIREKANYRFVDYNSDGYLDFIHESEYNSNSYIRYFDGTNFSDSIQLPINANNLKDRNWVDVNGDGLVDYTYFEGRMYYQLSLGGKRDLINTITDGSNTKRIIEYSTDVHTADDDAKSKVWGNGSQVKDVRGSIYLVESTRKMSGDLTTCGVTDCYEFMDFEYTGLKAQVDRGILGYRKFKVTDHIQNRTIDNEYRLDFPHTGKLISRTTTHGYNSDQFKETTNVTYATNSIGRSYASQTTTQTWDKNFPISSTLVVNSNVDEFARPGKVVSTITDSVSNDVFTTTEEVTYGFLQFYGGRPSKRVTKYDRTGETQIKQVAEFDYFAATGLLKSKTIDPTSDQGTSGANELNQNYGLTETYSRDDFGNVTSTTISGDDGIQRYAEVEYDLSGRFAEKQRAYPNYPDITDVIETSTAYHPIFGTKTSQTSANGQTTHFGYSRLGRLNFEYAPNGTTTTTKQTFCSVAGDCPTRAFFKEEITNSHGPDSVIYFDDMGRKVLEKTEMLACHNMASLANVCSDGADVKWVYKLYAYNNKGFKTVESRPYFEGELPAVTNFNTLFLAEGYATFESDSRGRAITEYRADRSKWTTSYNGLTSTITNPANNTTTKKVNVVGELVEMIDADGQKVEYAYDALGSLRLVRRSHSTISGSSGFIDTVIESDHLGRKVSMNDPDKGLVEYRYNSVGEMIWQKDNKGQVSEFDFDSMGRQIESRAYTDYDNLVLDHHTRTFYDTAVNGLGLVSEEEDLLNGIIQTYSYNVMSQVTRTKTTYSNGREFYSDVVYDDLFRVKETYDASHERAGIAYEYYDNYLVKKTDLQSGLGLWKFLEADALGNIRIFENGNGVVNYQQHNQNDGSLEYIMALRNNYTDIQHNLYNFDNLGNLEYRDDIVVGMKEFFNYDTLNRVDDWRVEYTQGMLNQVQTFDVNYDHLGNISDKTGMGNYTYGETICGVKAGPHAVTTAGSNTYCYDDNGNMVSGGGRNAIVYNTNDKPTLIQTSKNHQIEYQYGLGGSRFKRVDTAADGTVKETLYVGNVEYISENGALTKVLRHLEGVALETFIPQSGARKLEFLHRDHLGSVELITDITGTTVSKFSYDPWGNRRDDTTYVTTSFGAIDSSLSMAVEDFRRGYTGHEHIDEAGLIHMGGRVFDPRLARFLSADPFVKTTENLQSFNRYTYVSNNPLNRTDPSGYFEAELSFGYSSSGNYYAGYQSSTGFDNFNTAESLLRDQEILTSYYSTEQGLNWVAWDAHGNPSGQYLYQEKYRGQDVFLLDGTITLLGNVVGVVKAKVAGGHPMNPFTEREVTIKQQNEAWDEVVINTASLGQAFWTRRLGSAIVQATKYLDSMTPSGAKVHHGKHSTAIGSDEATMGNFEQAIDTGLGHNVIVHGSRPDYDEIGGTFVVDGLHTNSQQIADAVSSNPNYIAGTPVCLSSCWSGSNGTAQEVASLLQTTVNAPTRPTRFNQATSQWEQMTDQQMIYFGHSDLLHIKPEMKQFKPLSE